MCASVHVGAHTHAHMQKSEEGGRRCQVPRSVTSFSILGFDRRSLTESRTTPPRILLFPSHTMLGFRGARGMPRFFTRVLGI